MSGRAPVSPCVGLCTLDPDSGYCRGCLRSIDEIASWPRLDAEAKRRVISTLDARKAEAQGSHAPERPSPD